MRLNRYITDENKKPWEGFREASERINFMIPIKICGITNVKDAMFSAKSGVSAIGMIFCKKSPRYVSMDKAIEISSKIHPSIARVGVFVDDDEENIKYLIKKIPLSMLQLHGSESPITRNFLFQ